MNQDQLTKALKALETFDKAAKLWGWEEDQGHGSKVLRAQRLYKASKTRLTNMLKDIAAEDAALLDKPIVQLTREEQTALREAYDAIDGKLPPPEPVDEWQRLYCLIEDYVQARIADHDKGGGDPESYAEIEANLCSAAASMRSQIETLMKLVPRNS